MAVLFIAPRYTAHAEPPLVIEISEPVVYFSGPPVLFPAAPDKPTTTPQEAVVAEFGADHVMVRVASCESQYRQFDANGEVLRGRVNSQDVGVFQINEFYHLEEAKRLGLDIYSLAGNVAYARILYSKEGVAPWSASRHCWL